MEIVFQIVAKVIFAALMTFVFVVLPLLAHFGMVVLLGRSLMRLSVTLWRQELTALRWQRIACVFGFSPIVAVPLAARALAKWGSAFPLFGWAPTVQILGMGLILLFVPVLAGCWMTLPQFEGERFSAIRAWTAALVITFSDVIGAFTLYALLFG